MPAVPASFPQRSLAEVEAILCAPGAKFEMETVRIRDRYDASVPSLKGQL